MQSKEPKRGRSQCCGGSKRGPPYLQTNLRPEGTKKNFFLDCPPPPLSQDLDEWASPPPPPPYLKVWIRHCYDLVYRTQPPTHAGYQSVFLGGGAGGGMLRGWSHTESKPRAARLQLKTFSVRHFNETGDRA